MVGEGWLSDHTFLRRSRQTCDGEEGVHTPIARETNLPNRTLLADDVQRRQRVDLLCQPHGQPYAHLRIDRRTRSTCRRVGVTTDATVRVEPRPEALFSVRDAAVG